MAPLPLNHPLVLIFGILGNFISCVAHILPHLLEEIDEGSIGALRVALFSACCGYFTRVVKSNEGLLISINSFGCLIETVYIVMYLVYAPKSAKIFTVKMLLVLNVGVFALILLLTLLYRRAPIEFTFSVGSVWVLRERFRRTTKYHCEYQNTYMYYRFLRLVIRTKSVEFMPFSLSFTLTLSAVVWFGYGLLTKDKYVACNNLFLATNQLIIVIIFLMQIDAKYIRVSLGIMQMVLYIAYKNKRPMIEEYKLPEQVVEIVELSVTTERGSEVHPIDLKPQHACGEGPEAEAVERNYSSSGYGGGGSGDKDIEALEKGEMGHVEV
ncbi:Bidirectional sugar transporter SWEET14 [Ananas comosus]|uniref:Bidirectional sugar transporter SWEET n=1 Tax=Ananas comosus TaxID=4615 RepID=A0A199UPZ7_ANACO|nr:Bidirectional sugar transporter SWEET14 [Ananas comosus]